MDDPDPYKDFSSTVGESMSMDHEGQWLEFGGLQSCPLSKPHDFPTIEIPKDLRRPKI